MPDETVRSQSAASIGANGTDPRTKETSDGAPRQEAGQASEPLADAQPEDSSNPAPSDSKSKASGAKVDELEPPADIQTWPNEKPVVSKEDEDRLLKVCLTAI